jgi:hypothetical protein
MKLGGSDRRNRSFLSSAVDIKKSAAQFFGHLKALNQSVLHGGSDRFVWKALFAESVIWSIAAYGWTSYFAWTFSLTQLHLNQFALIRNGIILGIFAMVVLCGCVAFLFKGSSRGHRILIESFLVLTLSLPVGGIGMFHDINTGLGEQKATVIEAKVTLLEEKIHRKRSNKIKKSYHLDIDQNSYLSSYELKKNWKISFEQFQSIGQAQFVKFTIKPGYLGEPWIQSIEPSTKLDY